MVLWKIHEPYEPCYRSGTLRTRRILVVLLLLICGAITLAAVRMASSPERQLGAAYAAFNAALKNRDATALSRLLSPDFQEKRLQGELRNRAEAEANYRRLFENWVTFERQTVEIDRVTIKGKEALVIANKVTAGTMTDRTGAFGPKGESHKVVSDTMDVDVWVRTPEGWKLRFRQITLADVKVDGKHFSEGHAHTEQDHHEHE